MLPTGVRNRRVLLIEQSGASSSDSPGSMEPIRQTLMGFDVDTAPNHAVAIQKLQQSLGDGRPYAIAFTAGRTPTGWDELPALQRLWEIDRDLQVVVVTGQTNAVSDPVIEQLGLAEPAEAPLLIATAAMLRRRK